MISPFTSEDFKNWGVQSFIKLIDYLSRDYKIIGDKVMYIYQREKPGIFTYEGQILFLKIRDNIQRLFEIAGAARLREITSGCTGSTWTMLACIDRLVEIGEIKEITYEKGCAAQYRVFISNK